MIVDEYGVQHLGEAVAYVDGSEDSILETLLHAVDRSDGSDELTASIRDWPTKYHFSPQRSNLLRPLRIGEGHRVLELGCGSGPITRWLGEQGAVVTAVEGNLQRARAASVRCRGLENVTVLFGDISAIDLGEQFDFVVCVGVLEYSTSLGNGPDDFMSTCVRHLDEDGCLILAIENQIGLKYLIGYEEDHRGVPWVGLDDYPTDGARTWSRRQLSKMLGRHGLSEQRWMFPYPDYKLPTVTVAEELYERSDQADLMDKFVRAPVSPEASHPTLTCDARRSHRVLLDAGLGPDVANSFLVVAGKSSGRLGEVADDNLLWYFGANRQRPWRRSRSLKASPSGDLFVDAAEGPSRVEMGWLIQSTDPETPVASGMGLDRVISDAISRNDLDAVRRLLRQWADCLVVVDNLGGSEHPFAPPEGQAALRCDQLDINLPNYILDSDSLVYIDSEWQLHDPIDRSLVVTRALWYFAHELISGHHVTPWGPMISVDRLCDLLLSLAGEQPVDRDRFFAAEAALQELVAGMTRTDAEVSLRTMGALRPIDTEIRTMALTQLRAALSEVGERLKLSEEEVRTGAEHRLRVEQSEGRLIAEVATTTHRIQELEAQLVSEVASCRHRIEELESELQSRDGEHSAVSTELDRLRQECVGLNTELTRERQEKDRHRVEAAKAIEEIAAYRQTKTYRWTAGPRRIVAWARR